MGKHCKQKRKEYLKRRKRQIKERKNELECSWEINRERNNQDGCQVDEAPTSPESSDMAFIVASRIVNTNDREVIKRFLKPCKDPFYLSFLRYQENKRKLLNLVRNPLAN